MRKILLRSLAFTVFFASFVLLLSSNVMAGCCVISTNNVKSCSVYSDNSPDACIAQGGVLSPDSCSAVPVCEVGCCCDQNIAMRKISCSNQDSFKSNTLLGLNLQSGETCSCGDSHSIKGTVYDSDGLALGGASVSVGDKFDTSVLEGSSRGTFILTDVPSGSKKITASKDGCQNTIVIEPFTSDREGVSINLVCNCRPGCDDVKNAYCDGEQRVHLYNLLNVNEKAEYCQFCGAQDAADCGVAPLCISNDNSCPLGCVGTADLDCKCDANVANGICPNGCTSTPGSSKDIDCGYSINRRCGDGLITWPFESCEASPGVGQVNRCSISSCNANCNCISNSRCGDGVLDAGEACEGLVCSDGSACNACSCGQVCSASNKNPTLANPTFNKATKQINLTWSLANNCSSLIENTIIYACQGQASECTDIASDFYDVAIVHDRISYFFSPVVENTNYFFYVYVKYAPGFGPSAELDFGRSAIRSIKTGDEFCMNRPVGAMPQFCLGNKITKCDPVTNNLQVEEDCTVPNSNFVRFCVGPDIFNKVSCQNSNPCMNCNGLYGLFGKYLDLKIPIGSEDYSCSFSSANPAAKLVPNCFFEKNNGFIVGSFKTCDKVKSCYDFKSNDSCIDPRDPCGANSFSNKGCEWMPLGSSSSLGVCRPKSVTTQNCAACDDPLLNPISAKCTPQSCPLFGTGCQFQGANAKPSCSTNLVKTCGIYTSSNQCIGTGSNARAVQVNAVYNENKTRSQGNHLLTSSNDNSSLGKCYWDGSKCRRNADNLPVAVGIEGFDCQSNSPGCESDFENPSTKIISYTASANPVFKYSVSDNFHRASVIKTFFCIALAGTSCYPTELGVVERGEKVYKAVGINTSGNYILFFYSEDGSKNLEVVNQLPVFIDANAPFIDIISPRNDTQIATNANMIEVIGRTSTDVIVICAKNNANGFRQCLNVCKDESRNIPCIAPDSSGSSFNISVRVNSTSSSSTGLTSNIIIEAMDVVGNMYVNSINGIIFDIAPPGRPDLRVR